MQTVKAPMQPLLADDAFLRTVKHSQTFSGDLRTKNMWIYGAPEKVMRYVAEHFPHYEEWYEVHKLNNWEKYKEQPLIVVEIPTQCDSHKWCTFLRKLTGRTTFKETVDYHYIQIAPSSYRAIIMSPVAPKDFSSETKLFQHQFSIIKVI